MRKSSTETRAKPNVMSKVNKAYCLVKWKQDFDGAKKLCEEAFATDPACDIAAGTLAQFALQRGDIDEAIRWFETHLSLARTDPEVMTTIQCRWISAT